MLGGRISSYTGRILPIAVSGLDIRALANGAKTMEIQTRSTGMLLPIRAVIFCCQKPAAAGGRPVEIMVGIHSKDALHVRMVETALWRKRGEKGKGIFPASVT